VKFSFVTLTLLMSLSQAVHSQTAAIDSVISLLTRCWRWDNYYGGFAGFPPTPAWKDARLILSQDAQDSLNQTVSYLTIIDSMAADSGRAIVEVDTNNPALYYFSPDVLSTLYGGSSLFPLHFWFDNDSIVFNHQYIADDFFYVFVTDSCESAPATPYSIIDSFLALLTGCWRYDFFSGGFAGLPPTPSGADVEFSFSRDARDSLNQTLSYKRYDNSVVTDSGRVVVKVDTTSFYPSYLVPDIIAGFDSISFWFQHDTLLFTHGFPDDFTYGYLRDTCPEPAMQPNNIDTIIESLTGCWMWDNYYGGFAGLPPTPAWKDARLIFSQDAQDSLNQTVSYLTIVDSIAADSGRATVEADTNNSLWYYLSPDVLGALYGGVGGPFPLHFKFDHDSIVFTHFYIADDFFYVFVSDSCLPAPTTPTDKIDSIIELLTGCWRWDSYEAWGQTQLAYEDVRLVFSQDALDSVNRTITYRCYRDDSILIKTDRTAIVPDSSLNLYHDGEMTSDVLGAVHGAISGTVRNNYPTRYNYYDNDTLRLWDVTVFVDAPYYFFVKDSCTVDTTISPPDTTTVDIDSIIQLLEGCWKWNYFYGGFGPTPPTPAWSNVQLSLSQDAQDSMNQTVSYKTYENAILKTSGRATVGIRDSSYYKYFLTPDIFGPPVGVMGTYITFDTFSDTLEFTIPGFDVTTFAFLRDSCIEDTPSKGIDSVIGVLNGCWRWDFYFGGFPGIPPTAARTDVRIEFSQDAQDSMSQTVTGQSYLNDTLKFSGTCVLVADTNTIGYYSLSCSLFDSIGIVGYPPLYFYFEDDTLLFPRQRD